MANMILQKLNKNRERKTYLGENTPKNPCYYATMVYTYHIVTGIIDSAFLIHILFSKQRAESAYRPEKNQTLLKSNRALLFTLHYLRERSPSGAFCTAIPFAFQVCS